MSLVVVPNVFTYLFPKMEVITRKWNLIMDFRGQEHNLDTTRKPSNRGATPSFWYQ